MEQDAPWKRLFGRPVVVQHLLRGFAPEVAELLDLDTLNPLPASSATATSRGACGMRTARDGHWCC